MQGFRGEREGVKSENLYHVRIQHRSNPRGEELVGAISVANAPPIFYG